MILFVSFLKPLASTFFRLSVDILTFVFPMSLDFSSPSLICSEMRLELFSSKTLEVFFGDFPWFEFFADLKSW